MPNHFPSTHAGHPRQPASVQRPRYDRRTVAATSDPAVRCPDCYTTYQRSAGHCCPPPEERAAVLALLRQGGDRT